MAKSKSKAKDAQKQSYFVLVPYFPIYGLFLLASYVYLAFIIFAPNALPWFVGSYLTEFAKHLGNKYSFESRRLAGLTLVGAHVFETIVAVIISKLNSLNALTTLKWALQTSFFGIFSLRFLLALQFKSKKPETKKKPAESNYMEYVNPIWVILVWNGFYLLWAGIYDPEQIPKNFGQLGDLAIFLGQDYTWIMKIILFAAIFIHAAESIYAISICRRIPLDSSSSIKWGIQTFLMGMFSLKLLLRHYYSGNKP